MDAVITGGVSGGAIRAIPSKSELHRYIICSALSDYPAEISCPTFGDDISATCNCLKALGSDIKYEDGIITVCPAEPANSTTLYCGESGSTLRFLLPVIGALGINARIIMSKRLSQRPIEPLINELIRHGCVIRNNGLEIEISGKLFGGEFLMPANISSQFISGLLFALPLLNEDSYISLTGNIESSGYIEMTRQIQKKFGICSSFKDKTIYVPGRQKYQTPEKINVGGDWSNAAPWLCIGVFSERPVAISGLEFDTTQKDKDIIDILRHVGANIKIEQDCISVSKGSLNAVDIDGKDIPDIIPYLAVVSAGLHGASRFRNISRLRLKESDRINSIFDLLYCLDADIYLEKDEFRICGKDSLSGGTVDSYNDHRIAMAAAVASVLCNGAVTITGAECVSKSYPDFWKDLSCLGGKIEWRE